MSVAERFVERLSVPGGDETTLRRRPTPAVWSAAEYACHIRDVMIIQRERIITAMVEDTPRFSPMYRDERVTLSAYLDEPLPSVMAGVQLAGSLLAHLFEHLTSAQLARRCVYTYPEPTERDVLWVGRHTVHEGEHHLLDIGRVLEQTRRPS